MNISGVVAGVLVTLVLSCICGYYFFDERIKIERKIKPYSWMIIHVSVCAVTLLFMVTADYFYVFSQKFDITTSIIKVIIYILIQSGGLPIFVMLLSSRLYDTLVKACHYQYFVKSHMI